MWERIGSKEGCGCKGEAASELFGKNLLTLLNICSYYLKRKGEELSSIDLC